MDKLSVNKKGNAKNNYILGRGGLGGVPGTQALPQYAFDRLKLCVSSAPL